MSEKVRYFLEKSVPELKDLENKGLFEKNEITMIMRRRTDFEHRIQARGCKPRDYLKYIEFESDLEKLRLKRFKRLSSVGAVDPKKSISDYAGNRRIFFIYQRAVERYPNEFQLWQSYLNFAKKNGSVKVTYDIYTKVLQYHPTKVIFWISAANYEFEENFNVKAARVVFQKGLRFNKDSLELWLAYTEFELLYITKLLERRRILGLLTEKQQKENEQSNVKNSIFDDTDDSEWKIPTEIDDETKEQLKQLPEADINMLGNPETNPALRGDVALTIYDIAIKSLISSKLRNDSESKFSINNKFDLSLKYSLKFIEIFDKFSNLNRNNLVNHIITSLLFNWKNEPKILLLDITLPIRYDNVKSESFVNDLKLSVNKLQAIKAKSTDEQKIKDLLKLYVDYLNDKFVNIADSESQQTVSILNKIIKRIGN